MLNVKIQAFVNRLGIYIPMCVCMSMLLRKSTLKVISSFGSQNSDFYQTTFCHHGNTSHMAYIRLNCRSAKAGCFAIIFLQMYCYYKGSVALPNGAVGWSAVFIYIHYLTRLRQI